MDATTTVRFVLDGQIVGLHGVSPTMTVLEYLREVAHRTGTKEGCAEGDCGACTVVLGELSADASQIQYRAINSCIRLLPSIDGQELVTVESLRAPHGALHPVQQAMVDAHGSQCGFCTPGFVMSLFPLYLRGSVPSREQVVEALSGNLCRCTGYRPIIDAGCRMNTYPPTRHWGSDAPHSSTRCELVRSIQRQQTLRMRGWYAPRCVDELATALEADPEALILAGGTDVGLWVTKQLRELPAIIYIGEVREFKRLHRDESALTIGAAVSLTDAWAAIVKEWPQLAELAQRFGSPPVRNSGTLCGNIANGSPIGDSMPVLIALGAQLELRRGTHTRLLPLEAFYLGYQRKDLRPAEFVVCVRIPRSPTGQLLASYKVAKRFDQDISAVCAAFAVQLRDGYVSEVRIAFGGMAAVPSRARGAETQLLGASWTQESVSAAADALAQDFKPLTDLRASGAYRLQCARNLLHRFFAQTDTPSVAVRTAQAASAIASVPASVKG